MRGFVICLPVAFGPPAVLSSQQVRCSECHTLVHLSPASRDAAIAERLEPVCVDCLPLHDIAIAGGRVLPLSPAQQHEFDVHRTRL